MLVKFVKLDNGCLVVAPFYHTKQTLNKKTMYIDIPSIILLVTLYILDNKDELVVHGGLKVENVPLNGGVLTAL